MRNKRKVTLKELERKFSSQVIEPTSNPRIAALHLQALEIAKRVKKEGING